MKTKEELNALKEEVETVNEEPCKLTKEELEQVTGGFDPGSYEISQTPGFTINC